ncbi:MAG: tRNA (adenosine(37)-N6)-threonylcarbamoyltransferase complex dimerization subunit type 1 TsaB [Sphingomonadales bacterium]
MNLVIDTCGAALILAIADGPKVMAAHWEGMPVGHAEAIMPALAALLDEAELPAAYRFARIGVTVGPGSFTGLRVGLSVARARAAITGALLVPLNRLQVVAATSDAPDPRLVSLDARRSERFMQLFSSLADPLTSPAAVPNHQVADVYGHWQGAALIEEQGEPAALTAAMAQLTDWRPAVLHGQVAPLYVRAPDAIAQPPKLQTR